MFLYGINLGHPSILGCYTLPGDNVEHSGEVYGQHFQSGALQEEYSS
jgi:hypothetical protein